MLAIPVPRAIWYPSGADLHPPRHQICHDLQEFVQFLVHRVTRDALLDPIHPCCIPYIHPILALYIHTYIPLYIALCVGTRVRADVVVLSANTTTLC